MPNRPALQQLMKDCPTLHRLLLNSIGASAALDELEYYVQDVLSREFQAGQERTEALKRIAEAQNASRPLLEYVRLLQRLVTVIVEGKVTPPIRKAMQLVAEAWVVHRAAIDLGAGRREAVDRHIAEMQGAVQILFGISLEELQAEVYDKDIRHTDREESVLSPFAGVADFKT